MARGTMGGPLRVKLNSQWKIHYIYALYKFTFYLLTYGLMSALIDSIGSLLCERVLNVLFDVWILSCAHCFPAPSLWKTLQDMCSSWRHHDALVVQWHRVNVAFTVRLLRNIYSTTPQLPAPHGICIPGTDSHDA